LLIPELQENSKKFLDIQRRKLEAKFESQKATHLKEMEDAFEARVKQEVKI